MDGGIVDGAMGRRYSGPIVAHGVAATAIGEDVMEREEKSHGA
jgi:hypothetical protein